ncbi:MAG: hypothetical protein IJ614_06730 [Prevotella sp.]|nr:hypothetical protein [Prevotella sp.]
MKKTYMIPVMEIVKIQTQQMMASSPMLGGNYGGGLVLAPEQPAFDDINTTGIIDF